MIFSFPRQKQLFETNDFPCLNPSVKRNSNISVHTYIILFCALLKTLSSFFKKRKLHFIRPEKGKENFQARNEILSKLFETVE